MQIKIFDDYKILSEKLAEDILMQIKLKPDSVICLAAGDTPKLAYEIMVKNGQHDQVDFSLCKFIGLDEWVNVSPDNEGSCHYFLRNTIIKPLKIAPQNFQAFNALTNDLASECKKMDDTIATLNGIDLMIVGIGMNGHIGFNEPGVSFNLYSHVINLDNNTQLVGQKYFKHQTELKQGITLGLKHLMESKKVVLIANGSKKSDIIKTMLEGTVSPFVPASILREHANSTVMLDRDASAKLSV